MYPLPFSVHFSFTHWSSCRVSVQPYHLFLTSHVPPGSEGVLDRRLIKRWTWFWGIVHSRPPGPCSSRPTDESWGLAPCPLTIEPLCPEIPAQVIDIATQHPLGYLHRVLSQLGGRCQQTIAVGLLFRLRDSHPLWSAFPRRSARYLRS